jgi:Tol biopolymer transport system component
MNRPSWTESRLTAWLEEGPTSGPDAGLAEALARVRSTRQRPAWLERLTGDTMDTTWRALPVPSARFALLLLIALLTLGLGVGAIALAPRLLTTTTDVRNVAPVIPSGGAAVLAYDSNGDIYAARADGTHIRQLTDDPAEEVSPVFSPDGTRIAFWSTEGATVSLVVLDVASGASTVVDDDVGGVGGGSMHAWSPDGLTLVYARTAGGQSPHLATVPADASRAPTMLSDGMIAATDPAWSPQGDRIVFRGVNKDGPGIFIVAALADGRVDRASEAVRLSPIGMGGDAYSWSAPRWSPDGSSVATYAVTGTTSHDIVILPADGSGLRIPSAEPDDEWSPAWSPDGARIAFTAQSMDDYMVSAYVVDGDGSDRAAVRLTGPLYGLSPFWSPDGTRLLLTGPSDERDEDSDPAMIIPTFPQPPGTKPVRIPAPGNLSSGTWQPVVPAAP